MLNKLQAKLKTASRYSLSQILSIFLSQYVCSFKRVGRYSCWSDQHIKPTKELVHQIEFWQKEHFDRMEGSSPYLTKEDIAHFKRAKGTVCVVALDKQGSIIGSTWMVQGKYHLQEFNYNLQVKSSEYYSCRAYVSDKYRGLELCSHMIYHFAQTYCSHKRVKVWSHIFDWNKPSILAFMRAGWKKEGTSLYFTLFTRVFRIHL